MTQNEERNPFPRHPAWSLWQWFFPVLILAGFVAVAAWSIQFMRQADEEKFRLEALTNCKVLEVAIAGETTRDEGLAGIQSQIDALVDRDHRIVRLSFIARAEDGAFRHVASSLPERVGKPAGEEDLEAIASGEVVILEEGYREFGALDITFPVHDHDGQIFGLIGYTVSRDRPPKGPLELALLAIAVILCLVAYFLFQLRLSYREIVQRRQVEAVLRQTDRMKNEFISTAAHELRTPLTSVVGYAELLLHPETVGGLAETQRREFLQEIYEKAGALAKIVDDLLDISRIEAGHAVPLQKEPCDLGELVRREVAHLQLQAPGHRIELLLPAGGAPVVVDRHKLVQVLENLVGNAVKFSPAGGVIRVSVDAAAGSCQVAVADEGIGMTPEQVARVFDKFYRADASNTATGGLGLGMSIVRQIVETHGGRIWVESEPGKGTTVRFSVPQAEKAQAAKE